MALSNLIQSSNGKELNDIAAAKLLKELPMEEAIVETDQTFNAGENDNLHSRPKKEKRSKL